MQKKHYNEHINKSFYPNIEEYIISSPIVVLIISGRNAINKIRLMVGATEPSTAAPGTIRGDFAHQSYPSANEKDSSPIRNLVHASANLEDAQREIAIWFNENEHLDYQRVIDKQVSIA